MKIYYIVFHVNQGILKIKFCVLLNYENYILKYTHIKI
jgi:hypothetical protein